jgi:hypothetical protein
MAFGQIQWPLWPHQDIRHVRQILFAEGDHQDSPALAKPTLGTRSTTRIFAEGDEQGGQAKRFAEGDQQESPALTKSTLGMRPTTRIFAEGDEQIRAGGLTRPSCSSPSAKCHLYLPLR